MTCIVGLIGRSSVYLGGDSAGVGGWDLTVRRDSKVFHNGPYLMGFTSSFRMGQLLKFNELPQPPFWTRAEQLECFMATEFIDGVRNILSKGGYRKKVNEQEEGGSFLVAVNGCLFKIDDDFQVGIPHDPFSAVGCGSQIAHGALHVLQNDTSQFDDRKVIKALEAAERFSAGVRAPFTVLSQERRFKDESKI